MVTTNDKISFIIDADQLFDIFDSDVQLMMNGDTYRIDELYINSLEIFKNNHHLLFRHCMSDEVKTLKDWAIFYQSNINDPKSIIIFSRFMLNMLSLLH